MASAVGATLTVSEKAAIEAKPTENLQAYDFFLRGMYYWRSEGSVEANDKAITMFEKAVELDPRFVKAEAWIAYVHSMNYDPAFDPSPARREKALRALHKATAMNPNIPEVHLAAAQYAWFVEADFEGAEAEFRQALAARPNDADILFALTQFYYHGKAEPATAIPYLIKLADLDPYGLGSTDMLSLSWQLVRNWDEAEKWADFIIAHAPDAGVSYFAKCYALLFGRGDVTGARRVYVESRTQGTKSPWYCRNLEWDIARYARDYSAALDTLNRVDPQARSRDLQRYGFSRVGSAPTCDWALGWTYSLLGERTKATSYFEKAQSAAEGQVRERPSDKSARVQLGLAYAGLGQREAAINEANEARRLAYADSPADSPFQDDFGSIMRDVAHIYIMTGEYATAISMLDSLLSVPSVMSKARLRLDPMYDSLRGNPRFQSLLAKDERIPVE